MHFQERLRRKLNTKRLAFLLAATLILVRMGLGAVAYSVTADDNTGYWHEEMGLLVEIEITPLAWPGEKANVTLRAVATQANIHIRYIHVNVSSLKENRSQTLLSSISFLNEAHIGLGESNSTSYEVAIPEDTSPGLLYGEVEYEWSLEGDGHVEEQADVFLATYVQNKPYEALKQDYDALNGFYSELQGNHTELAGNYTDLQERYQELVDEQAAESNATGLMYIFIITTAIFVATTIILLVKQPKTTW